MLSAFEPVDHRVHDVDLLLYCLNTFGDAIGLGEFQGLVDNFEVEFKVFAIGYSLDSQRHVFLDLFLIIQVPYDGSECLHYFDSELVR